VELATLFFCLRFEISAAFTAIFRIVSSGNCDSILLAEIQDSPNLEVQVPVFISPKNRVFQLYHQALNSQFVASYILQG
jgi:hypothetical protein